MRKSKGWKVTIFFSIRNFFHGNWQLTGQLGKGEDHLLFHSTTSTRSQTFRHLFATLHVRWLSHIFNRNACIYQAAGRWDLPPYRNTIWLMMWCWFPFVCLLIWFQVLLQLFDIRNRWIQIRIDYHPCITGEPTNQVSNANITYLKVIWLIVIRFSKFISANQKPCTSNHS